VGALLEKNMNWTFLAKVFGIPLFVGMIMAQCPPYSFAGVTRDNINTQNQAAYGNNLEAEGFARDMNRMSNGKIVWHLDLTPQTIEGHNIVDYRKIVSYCKAAITITADEWLNLSETQQKNYIRSSLDALHNPPLFNLSKVLDYYPHSSGEVTIFVDGKVVARGKYSKKQTEIVLQPGTYKPDEVGKYWAKINVGFETVGIKFEGTTNMPDSTAILFTFSKGFSNKKYIVQSKVAVHNGAFSTETFQYHRNPFPFGKYSLHLNVGEPMFEARGIVILPDTKNLTVNFSPTKMP
jgi:hypothetical protein